MTFQFLQTTHRQNSHMVNRVPSPLASPQGRFPASFVIAKSLIVSYHFPESFRHPIHRSTKTMHQIQTKPDCEARIDLLTLDFGPGSSPSKSTVNSPLENNTVSINPMLMLSTHF